MTKNKFVWAVVLAVVATSLLSLITPFVSTSAIDIFVANANAGGNTGADCANAHAISFVSNAANWGAGATQIGAGTTVHFCGTITTGVNGTFMTCQGNGSSGAPVTFKWEIGAQLTSPAMGDGIICTNRQWITFEGQVDGSGLALGTIRNTANGTGLANQLDSAAINLDGTTHVTVHGVSCTTIYIHSSASDENAFGNCFQMNSGTALNDVHFLNNHMSDAYHGMLIAFSGTNVGVLEIAFNVCSALDNCLFLGDRDATGNLSNVSFHDNVSSHGFNWFDNLDNNHVEHIHPFGQNGGVINGMLVYNNTSFGDCGANCTALYFIEGNVTGIRVFNNTLQAQNNGTTNALLTFKGPANNMQAYNNTIDCGNTGGNGVQSETNVATATFINNIIMNCGNRAIENNTALTIISDFNDFFNNAGIATSNVSFASWQATGHDTHSKNTNPGVTAGAIPGGIGGIAYTPNSTGVAVCVSAQNETALGITQLNVDMLGTARPTGSNPWDIGSVQCSGSPPPPPPPSTTAPSFFSRGMNRQSGRVSLTRRVI